MDCAWLVQRRTGQRAGSGLIAGLLTAVVGAMFGEIKVSGPSSAASLAPGVRYWGAARRSTTRAAPGIVRRRSSWQRAESSSAEHWNCTSW
jgi:hypothetical protein